MLTDRVPSNRRLQSPPDRTGSLVRGSYNFRKRSLRRSRCEPDFVGRALEDNHFFYFILDRSRKAPHSAIKHSHLFKYAIHIYACILLSSPVAVAVTSIAVVELEFELIQTQMTQKPMLRAEVYAHAMRASKKRLDRLRDFVVAPSSVGGNSSPLHDSQCVDELATLDRYHHFHGHSGLCA